MPADAERLIPVGSFTVETSPGAVAAFAEAVCLGKPQPAELAAVPATFPMTWLVRSDVMAAVRRLAGGEGAILIHETQEFTIKRPLEPNARYVLRLSHGVRPGRPLRVVLSGDVAAAGGETVLTLETVLLVVTEEAMAERRAP